MPTARDDYEAELSTSDVPNSPKAKNLRTHSSTEACAREAQGLWCAELPHHRPSYASKLRQSLAMVTDGMTAGALLPVV